MEQDSTKLDSTERSVWCMLDDDSSFSLSLTLVFPYSASSALLIHFPRISDTKKLKEEENSDILIKENSVHEAVVCAHHTKNRFWSRQQYDNLVRLACFIRRYFSNATLASSHVAPIIHTCSGSGVVQTSLKCRTNPNELYRNRLKSCTFYEMRINEILKFWWREFSLLGRLECGAWRAWDREPIRN